MYAVLILMDVFNYAAVELFVPVTLLAAYQKRLTKVFVILLECQCFKRRSLNVGASRLSLGYSGHRSKAADDYAQAMSGES